MALSYQSGGDLSTGGTRLTEPGTYHVVVTDVSEAPTKKDGSLISNAAFSATVGVLEGTTPNQRDKTVNMIFFHGKPGEEKSEAFAKKKMDRFFLATGLLTQQQIETKWVGSIELTQAVGRQLVAKFGKEKPEDRFVDLEFAEIYHVDDPAVKDAPKCQQSLKLIAPALRWPGGKPAAPAKGSKPTPAKQPVPAGATDGGRSTEFDDLGDL